jgi:hypothetical protein
MNAAKYKCNSHWDDQSSSSAILDGGAGESCELEYPSLIWVRIAAEVDQEKLPDISHEEIDAGIGGSPR